MLYKKPPSQVLRFSLKGKGQLTMATTRLLRTFKPMTIHSSSASSSSSSSPPTIVRYLSKDAGLMSGEQRLGTVNERKQMAIVKASVASSETETLTTSKPQVNEGVVHLATLVTKTHRSMLILLRTALKRKSMKMQVQMFIEKGIIDCRFFTLLAVAGSLLGSVLCFVEGCFIVLESYFQYFHALSHKTDQGHMVHLLIEAIDMFLVGTAMLIFGVGMYAMFMGSKAVDNKGPRFTESNLFGLFYMKSPPAWVDMKSVSQAKSKIGHAVVMILQVGLLEKFNSIPLVTPLDLACFAGAVLVSSACILILSRLDYSATTAN
ncbi:uncharacterized protein LOC126783343 [Argentina anserina]|uniref:uncharacterized protein LOC126783343 n=1 Tax=Argentina anserina TaxID=57926 RepID=UPI0021764C14|nr:uncharacterized protein LOC126783343 [Potentilla anserina]